MRRKRHDARHAGHCRERRSTPQRIQMILTHAGKPRTVLDAPRPSYGALRERLIIKGYTSEVVDDVIERLTRVQLIDDEAYAQSAVRYCATRLMGCRGAVAELTERRRP
ncbi:MAG: RecX family transcriptional regulator [Bifidobacterium adolescentis]